MAHINATFKHDYHDISIEVLEPTKSECDYEEGMQIKVNWDVFSISFDEFIKTIRWLNSVANHIDMNFEKDGKTLKRKVVTKRSEMAKILREMEFTKKMHDEI
jgi:hypothetical protein